MSAEQKVYKVTQVEWTNPLTGDGEYCTIEFVLEDNRPSVTKVLWERTKEDCVLRYIEENVAEELDENLDRMIEEGEVPGLENGYPADETEGED